MTSQKSKDDLWIFRRRGLVYDNSLHKLPTKQRHRENQRVRASRASIFTFKNCYFFQYFCWYFRYFVDMIGHDIVCRCAHVPTKLQKGIMAGGGGGLQLPPVPAPTPSDYANEPPPPPGYAIHSGYIRSFNAVSDSVLSVMIMAL